MSENESIERQDVCVKCGHNNLSVDGRCRQSVAVCSDGYHGTRECGCKCVFPSISPAAADPVVGPMKAREAAFEEIWRRQFVEPFNKKYSTLPLYDTESAERYVRRAVRFLLTGSLDGPFPSPAAATPSKCPDCGCAVGRHNAVNDNGTVITAHCRDCGSCWKSAGTPFVDAVFAFLTTAARQTCEHGKTSSEYCFDCVRKRHNEDMLDGRFDDDSPAAATADQELLPCDYCGGQPTTPFFSGHDQLWLLRCFGTSTNKHSLIEFRTNVRIEHDSDNVEDARQRLIKMWNTRASRTPLPKDDQESGENNAQG